MLRTKLRNHFLKAITRHESRMKYNKQRNICVSIRKKAKQSYYENLNLKDITNNNNFGLLKHFFPLRLNPKCF